MRYSLRNLKFTDHPLGCAYGLWNHANGHTSQFFEPRICDLTVSVECLLQTLLPNLFRAE